jgi:hypothetical protein
MKEHICDDEDVNILSKTQKRRFHPRTCHADYTGDQAIQMLDNENSSPCENDVISQASVEYEPADVVEKDYTLRATLPALSKRQLYFKRYLRFINSPRVIFFYEIFFFSIYLILFSYLLLVKFNYYEIGGDLNVTTASIQLQSPHHDDDDDDDEDEDEHDEMSTLMRVSNRTTSTTTISSLNGSTQATAQFIGLFKKRKKFRIGKEVHEKGMTPPVFIEYLLVYWVVMFFIEEISQVNLIFNYN